MFKKVFAFISVLALLLAVPTQAYAVSRSGHETKSSGSTNIPGNQNHNQCLPPAGFVNTGSLLQPYHWRCPNRRGVANRFGL